MFERLAGVWLGIVILAAWSIVCILLSLVFVGIAERIVIVGTLGRPLPAALAGCCASIAPA